MGKKYLYLLFIFVLAYGCGGNDEVEQQDRVYQEMVYKEKLIGTWELYAIAEGKGEPFVEVTALEEAQKNIYATRTYVFAAGNYGEGSFYGDVTYPVLNSNVTKKFKVTEYKKYVNSENGGKAIADGTDYFLVIYTGGLEQVYLMAFNSDSSMLTLSGTTFLKDGFLDSGKRYLYKRK